MTYLDMIFNEIKYIQNNVINTISYNNSKKYYKVIDELIDDSIEETIYRIMEFFDGYSNTKNHFIIKNTKNGILLNTDIFDLHDKWYNYINNYTYQTNNVEIDSLFVELKNIKNDIYNCMKSNIKKYNEDYYAIILSITLKTIYYIFCIIDGYNNKMIKYSIIDMQNKVTINDKNVLLHLNILNRLL